MNSSKSAGNKRLMALGIVAASALFFMANCSGQTDVVEIGERMYIGQVNDIYLNADDYLGKTIKLEGVLKKFATWDRDYYLVVRYGTDECCDDTPIGFEVAWARNQSFPEPESWVEAIGVLRTEKVNDFYSYLYLDLSSLNVLSRRGAEFVRQ